MDSSYPRAVLGAALQGLLTGVWVAAGELPAGRRRLVRAGSVLSLSAVASLGDRAAADDADDADDADHADHAEDADHAADADEADELAEPPASWNVDKRKLAVTAVSLGVSVGLLVGRRRLEKRWLAGLTRAGHPHPQRALALRLGLLSFAGTLPGRLVRVHESRRGR